MMDWQSIRNAQPERVADALRFATLIIEGYEGEIRETASTAWPGVNLVEKGFCQGSIYSDALPRIMRILDGRSTSGIG